MSRPAHRGLLGLGAALWAAVACAPPPEGPLPACADDPRAAVAPAFPGAEGAGARARGGRCGDVYVVHQLGDAGPGSLRHAIESATGPRSVVFAVAGTIWLERPLRIRRPFLTLAGQTAPGEGITIAGRTTRIEDTHDVVVRYLRFRPGPGEPGSEPDALSVVDARDVMIDHVSASWAVDEVLSVTHGSHRVSVQWSFITEALHEAGHHKGNHGYGSLVAGGEITFHHDLFAHNRSRNPRPGGADGRTRVVFANNVIHNPGGRFGYAGDEPFDLLYLANYASAGPDTLPGTRALFMAGGPGNRVHQAGNWRDLVVDGVLSGRPVAWSGFRGAYTPQREPPFEPGVALEPAPEALERVLALGGASRARDAVDRRIVASVRAQSGAHIDAPEEVGGWPVLQGGPVPPDTDADGLPDAWERDRGLDPHDPDDRNRDDDADGYTALEDWLHHRARPQPSANPS